ncbi:uncharacterized protein LOC115743537 [Rhodamnia argentea]|uniref:Uncharacterized protein LOC115743537 n=1 Tax=Rhodamnia argentea TaxID=178133 RepID=A0A8B8PHE8_9MYRT|nr:uncharacterized protein LOC115743537 [Rhodamnia argentea]
MAMAAACCLNPSPPTPRSSNSSSSSSSSSMASRTVQVPWNRNGARSGAAARVAMVVIGLVEMGNTFMGAGEIPEAMALETPGDGRPEDGVARVARWSEKRACPPWRLNSLETIVPENLPRPHAHRRSESVGFSDRQDAPALNLGVAISNPRCFSM